ncbi:acyltransferase family protein [Saccharothrix variisporea]|uniref:Acyltransferase-like protein n=1 Tax=Saccharothrix variisporea TaxID=543527 RepID=A0A495X5Y8_9PSEU|nr:acyltransferase [Saccharothrix variisporea]RKT68063.1 acyltransferase-like protein [Saccharothrix variisporea]
MTAQVGQRSRLAAVDNLKVLLVAWVIGGHALLGYSAVGGWPYDEVNEVTFAPRVEAVLAAVLGPSGLFLMGTFYLLSGLFTPGSLARKGRGRFVRERLVRLGIPWVVSALLVWPLSLWVAYRAAGRDVSPWWVFTHRDPLLDSGSLWFVLILLLFSLACAVVWRPAWVSPVLTTRYLVLVTAGVAVTTFVVRLWAPARSGQVGDLHIWWWPQLLAMFWVGVVGARTGLAGSIPERMWRLCRVVAFVAIASVPVTAIAAGVSNLSGQSGPFLGGWRWQALLLAVVESVLVVGGSIWLLGLAQRRLTAGGPFAGALARSAFAAFVLQGPVLVLLAVAARPVPLPAEVKAFAVALAGVAVSFGVGRLVTAHTRLGRFF